MKGKILGFFCSLILLSASVKGQTIDGVLYTNFNNYYKWRGGAFDSTLLIPQIAASIGRRPGAIYYKSSDSSLYSWTGTQWRKVGDGGSIPTLQQVTTAGKTTTDTIKANAFRIPTSIGTDVIFSDDGQAYRAAFKIAGFSDYAWLRGGQLELINSSGFNGTFNNNNGTKNNTINLPDSSGILTQRVAINGTTYNTAANGVVDIGNTDTATVVKAYVTNAESVTITKGQVVYIFGASGDRASVKLARNTSDTFSSKTLGIVRADIAAGAAGWITTQGQVSGINLGAYSPGDILWLDSVPGGFTATKPQAPYHGVFVGVVERANPGNGLIYVKPQNGVELSEIHDVRITSIANNDIIRYNSSLGYWENKTVESILQFDTIPLAVFGAGSGAAGDTLAFSTSAVYGSFYNAGSDTLIITQMRAGVLGTSPSITTEVYWNDSLNITAGATILVSGGTSVTGTIGATNVTSFTNNKIPPNVWVFVRTSAVATKPTYFTLTLLGYKKRI
jgi:hypothetical protein